MYSTQLLLKKKPYAFGMLRSDAYVQVPCIAGDKIPQVFAWSYRYLRVSYIIVSALNWSDLI